MTTLLNLKAWSKIEKLFSLRRSSSSRVFSQTLNYWNVFGCERFAS